tara:strand:+ start:3161 stop:4228 length:1068 start_codon:yes stop_codon:yes gene_type:complete
MVKSKMLISKIDRPKPDSSTRKNVYRFEKNERTTLFDLDVFNNIIKTITPFDLVAYAELEPFYNSVSNWLEINRNQLLITAGADQGIKSLFETFLEINDEVINFKPNYAMYSVYTKMFGGKEIINLFDNDLSIDIDKIISQINFNTKFIIISNPGHNGIVIKEEKIVKLIDHIQNSNTMLIIDEAYVDFSKLSMINYIKKSNNIIIVRTMSKGFGLASIRVGFIISCKQIIDEVYRVKPVHEITGIAAKIGKFLIENISIRDEYVENVNLGKKVLIKRFKEMEIDFFPSNSNFMYFKLNNKIDSKYVFNELQDQRIYIRPVSNIPPFKNYLRVTIGDNKQMEFFCARLKLILEKL